jgi:hypothetical protein
LRSQKKRDKIPKYKHQIPDKLQIQKSKQKKRNLGFETRNPESEIRNPELKKCGAVDLDLKAKDPAGHIERIISDKISKKIFL